MEKADRIFSICLSYKLVYQHLRAVTLSFTTDGSIGDVFD